MAGEQELFLPMFLPAALTLFALDGTYEVRA
jgi:hypothetical protein